MGSEGKKLVRRPRNGQVVTRPKGPGSCEGTSAGLAELFEPANEGAVVGRLNINKFHAHADARLDDADDAQCFDDLPLVVEDAPHAGLQRQGLAGADKAATHGNIGGNARGASARFEVEKLGIRGKGVANRVAAVADGQSSPGAFRSAIVHRDNVAHSVETHKKRARQLREVLSLSH
jgi:hypothetical protein